MFLADSEFTLEIANTYTVCLRWVHDRILVDDAVVVDSIDSDMQAINH
jgi:hypothetical protein